MKKKNSRDKRHMQPYARTGNTAQSDPPSPVPTEVPPGAPAEAPPGSPVEAPQPDAPPQPNNAPPPQAATLYIRFLQRHYSSIIRRYPTFPAPSAPTPSPPPQHDKKFT